MRRGSHGQRNPPNSLLKTNKTKKSLSSRHFRARGNRIWSLCDMLQPRIRCGPGNLGMSFCYVYSGMPTCGGAQAGGESAKACASNS
jgi:hypothetical protein